MYLPPFPVILPAGFGELREQIPASSHDPAAVAPGMHSVPWRCNRMGTCVPPAFGVISRQIPLPRSALFWERLPDPAGLSTEAPSFDRYPLRPEGRHIYMVRRTAAGKPGREERLRSSPARESMLCTRRGRDLVSCDTMSSRRPEMAVKLSASPCIARRRARRRLRG